MSKRAVFLPKISFSPSLFFYIFANFLYEQTIGNAEKIPILNRSVLVLADVQSGDSVKSSFRKWVSDWEVSQAVFN